LQIWIPKLTRWLTELRIFIYNYKEYMKTVDKSLIHMRRATIFAQAATSFFALVCVVLMKFAGGAVAGSRAMARGNPWQACNQAGPEKSSARA